MTNEKATRSFLVTTALSMTAFMAMSLLITFGEKLFGIPSSSMIYLAIAGGIFLVNAIWAHWRYIMRIDEFLRLIQIKAVLVGLSAILAIASIWGYLELYLDAPNLPIFYLNPIYWVFYALGAGILTKQAEQNA